MAQCYLMPVSVRERCHHGPVLHDEGILPGELPGQRVRLGVPQEAEPGALIGSATAAFPTWPGKLSSLIRTRCCRGADHPAAPGPKSFYA